MNVLYTYKKCSTCRKATAFLRERGIEFEERPIRERPPSPEELRRMLALYDGNLRRLFNTSGEDYRKADLKERMPELTPEEGIQLLAGNGNLIKRPFLLTPEGGLVGFRQDEWEQLKD